jgi:hypothetical protein
MRFNSIFPRWGGAVLALLGALSLADRAGAQRQEGPALPSPRLLIVTPCGGKVGTTVEITCTGSDLEDAQGLLFSHPGLKGEVLEQAPPTPDAKDTKGRRPRQPAPTAAAKFKVTIANDVPVGIHDIRVVNKLGVSNPRAFVVGDLAEVQEKEPNNDDNQAQKVDLNTTVTGTINQPTDVDYYTFSGKKGQRVVVSCLASAIDSRLQPVLELYDKAGRQIAYNRSYHNNDALVDSTLPADGDYFVRLSQFTHTVGTPEYYYRLSISTAPWIDAIFPPVVEPGKPAKLTVYGRNLPGGQLDPQAVVDGRALEKLTVTVNVPNDPMATQRLAYTGHLPPSSSGLDGFEYRIKNASGMSNPFLLTYAQAPVVVDNGANDKPEQAQEVPVPCEIAGWIEKKRDQDWYSFSAKKDDIYSIELVSERMGAPTYMNFTIINAATKQVVFESPEAGNQETLAQFKFQTQTADPPRYQFKAAADGKYLLLVRSQVGDTQAGPRHLYAVRITPNQPDFRLVLMAESHYNPDACVVRQGGSHYFEVYVWRNDGFSGAITLTAEGLPPGVTCGPQTIGPAEKAAALAITAAPDAAAWSGEIKVKGTATIDGKTVVREARAGSITWPIQQQQNVVTISRVDRNVVLAVRESAPYILTATPDKSAVKPGDKINITLKVDRKSADFKGPLQVSAAAPLARNQGSNLSFNNNNQPVAISGNGGTAALTVSNTAPPGTYTVVLRGAGQMPFAKDPAAKQKPNLNAIQAATPFTITVVPRDLATVTLAPGGATVKQGAQTEVVVRVARKYDFAGEFKVQVMLPKNAKGVTVEDVTIPAGKDEAKLVIKAAGDAPVTNLGGLAVRATAMFNGTTPIDQEAKFSINVTK